MGTPDLSHTAFGIRVLAAGHREMDLGGVVIQRICHAALLLWKRWFLSETLSSLGSMRLPQQLLLPLTTMLSYKIYSFLLVLLSSYLRNAYFTRRSCTGLTEQRFKVRLGHILFLLSPDTHSWEPREGLFSHIPAIETGRKQRTVDKSSLSSLLEALCTTPRALTPSIFLYSSPTPHNQPFPLLKTANPMCAFPTYRQEKESTLRALTETLRPACLSLMLL